jgi:hypothetical protein
MRKYIIGLIHYFFHNVSHITHQSISLYDKKNKCIMTGCYTCGKTFWIDSQFNLNPNDIDIQTLFDEWANK